MRETSFIEQNKEKWKEFEKVLDRQYKDPDKLNELFVQITDDLSYSRTFYPNRSVRVYLNSLAQRIFFTIYKNQKSKIRRLFSFWTDELPQLLFEARKDLLLAFLLFVFAIGIGVLSSVIDGEFARIVLGDSYVNMTLENIESGDPMAVYKERGELGMSLSITGNNIWVAMLTFVLGVFFRIGTMGILIQNGIMLGCFQYFFIEKGLFQESFLTIWIHGTLEISAIVIAGAAGMVMGRGLIFPGTYSRFQAFQKSARRGVKILMGTIPLFIIAGFLEGYLTRHTETSDAVRGIFILSCLLFVLAYFVFYPLYKARVGFKKPLEDTKVLPSQSTVITFGPIKSSGQIFADIFTFFKKHLGKINALVISTSFLYCLMVFLIPSSSPTELFRYPAGYSGIDRILNSLSVIDQFFINEQVGRLLLFLVNIVVYTLLSLFIYRMLLKENKGEQPKFSALIVFNTILGVCLLQGIFQINTWFAIFLILPLMPIPLLWIYVSMREGLNLWNGFSKTFSLMRRNYSRILGLFTILFFIGLSLFALTDTVLIDFFLNMVTWIVYLEEEAMNQFSIVLFTFMKMYIIHLVYTLLLLGSGFLFYTLNEIKEASNLKEKILSIGSTKRIKGLEKEV